MLLKANGVCSNSCWPWHPGWQLVPLIGSPEDEHVCRQLVFRRGGRMKVPALLIPSLSIVFNQDEKSRDRKGLTNNSFAPLLESGSLGPDRHCLEQSGQQQPVRLPELQLFSFPVVSAGHH